jgi:hypothetical protein
MSLAWLHPQFVQQGDEIWVGPVVEDDEAGIDAVVTPTQGDFMGMNMASDVVAGLEEGDVMVGVQAMGGGQAGDAAANDGDPHGLVSQRWGTSRTSANE